MKYKYFIGFPFCTARLKRNSLIYNFFAERQGFEPRVPLGTTVFKTAAIDHSATSPKLYDESRAKIQLYFLSTIVSYFFNDSIFCFYSTFIL